RAARVSRLARSLISVSLFIICSRSLNAREGCFVGTRRSFWPAPRGPGGRGLAYRTLPGDDGALAAVGVDPYTSRLLCPRGPTHAYQPVRQPLRSLADWSDATAFRQGA